MEDMKYADIKHCDRKLLNGTGRWTSLFVSGCTTGAGGCFNEIAWDFNGGNEFTDEAVQVEIRSLWESYISGLSPAGRSDGSAEPALLPLSPV